MMMSYHCKIDIYIIDIQAPLMKYMYILPNCMITWDITICMELCITHGFDSACDLYMYIYMYIYIFAGTTKKEMFVSIAKYH